MKPFGKLALLIFFENPAWIPKASNNVIMGKAMPFSTMSLIRLLQQIDMKKESMLLATSKTNKQNKHASLLHKSVMRKEFPRMAKAVVNQKAALAKLSAVNRSLKVAKSGVKNRNKQPVRTHGRK
ncbi:hypothetical protein Gogos_012775 [Gossypium gossypioides]|uniref:Ribosomal L28e/Mak16 domain-containing protein n=1 Tax=Gossypium gossypioides TaxID=34282 RepID=A0A7J9BTH9_GOSGO|nr:hypothetical protein [Gossypium gossypioides]